MKQFQEVFEGPKTLDPSLDDSPECWFDDNEFSDDQN